MIDFSKWERTINIKIKDYWSNKTLATVRVPKKLMETYWSCSIMDREPYAIFEWLIARPGFKNIQKGCRYVGDRNEKTIYIKE